MDDKKRTNPQETKKQHFSIVPNKLWDMPIKSNSIRVWGFINAQKEGFNPSSYYIADKLSMARGTVRGSIQELIELNMIRQDNIPYKKPTTSVVHEDEWVKNSPRSKIDLPQVKKRPTLGQKLTYTQVKNCPTNNTKTILTNKTKLTILPPLDLEAAELWKSYIHDHHSKRRKVKVEDEARAMTRLRKEFGWDNDFLKSLIKYLIKTKTPDKTQFSYYWYAFHLKWFLALTSDRSQRKAESIQGQVEQWEHKQQQDEPFITREFMEEFRQTNMQNVTPIFKGVEGGYE